MIREKRLKKKISARWHGKCVNKEMCEKNKSLIDKKCQIQYIPAIIRFFYFFHSCGRHMVPRCRVPNKSLLLLIFSIFYSGKQLKLLDTGAPLQSSYFHVVRLGKDLSYKHIDSTPYANTH